MTCNVGVLDDCLVKVRSPDGCLVSDTRSVCARRVGVILCNLGKLNITALKYLIVHLNTLQASVEFELVAVDSNDPLIALLAPGSTPKRDHCRGMLPDFRKRVLQQVTEKGNKYNLAGC